MVLNMMQYLFWGGMVVLMAVLFYKQIITPFITHRRERKMGSKGRRIDIREGEKRPNLRELGMPIRDRILRRIAIELTHLACICLKLSHMSGEARLRILFMPKDTARAITAARLEKGEQLRPSDLPEGIHPILIEQYARGEAWSPPKETLMNTVTGQADQELQRKKGTTISPEHGMSHFMAISVMGSDLKDAAAIQNLVERTGNGQAKLIGMMNVDGSEVDPETQKRLRQKLDELRGKEQSLFDDTSGIGGDLGDEPKLFS